MFEIFEHVLPAQHIREYAGASKDDQHVELKLHVKQYVPRTSFPSPNRSITLIAAHANGFPKELYEPLWLDLQDRLIRKRVAIRSIWIADVAHQGISGRLNASAIGNDPSWNDHSRDLLLMVNHFRNEMQRPLVGIGHSMGGYHLAQLALLHPRLLHGVVMIDPIIQTKGTSQSVSSPHVDAARLSTYRRDRWSSAEEAREYFRRSKFFMAWDPRVLNLWLQYGLRQEKDQVVLMTTRHQEVFTFLRPNFQGQQGVVDHDYAPDLDPDTPGTIPFYRPEPVMLYAQLPHLRPATLFIFGGRSAMHSAQARTAIVRQTGVGVGGSGGRVDMIVSSHGGHLMPMEEPNIVAQQTAGWIATQMDVWEAKDSAWQRSWTSKSRDEKTKITRQWEDHIGGRKAKL